LGAPLLWGGGLGIMAVVGLGRATSAARRRALEVEVDRLEDDVLIVARLKDW
jgi:hypothetical protein